MDFVSLTPPMIPSIIVHCVNEIEQRGLNEVRVNLNVITLFMKLLE